MRGQPQSALCIDGIVAAAACRREPFLRRGDRLPLLAMLLRTAVACLLLLPAACGGGGGGGGAAPRLSGPARLAASPVEIPVGAQFVDVLVELAAAPTPLPVLLQVGVDLPTGLALPPTNRLHAATALSTLDGDFVDNQFVILCGDARNADAEPLLPGPLFRLRVTPSVPRTPGVYTLRLQDLRAASPDGKTPIAVETTPTTVEVAVR